MAEESQNSVTKNVCTKTVNRISKKLETAKLESSVKKFQTWEWYETL